MMILFKVVAILDRMHSRQYLHLDLKPGNSNVRRPSRIPPADACLVLCNAEGDFMLIDGGGVRMTDSQRSAMEKWPE
jgi:serine/threonine protein kinase